MILRFIPNCLFWLHAKIGSKEAQICISNTIGAKTSKPIGNETLRWEKCL